MSDATNSQTPVSNATGADVQSVIQHDTSGLLGGVISLVLALVVGAISVYQAYQAGKAKAATLHQADVTAEQLKEHQADVVNAQGMEQVAAALQKVNDAEEQLAKLQDTIKSLTDDHAAAIAKISSITSFDAFVVRRQNETVTNSPAIPPGASPS